MDLVTLDFETYYSPDYSLSKMSTRDYVDDPRFEIIGVAIKDGVKPTMWLTDMGEIAMAFAAYDWSNTAVLGHNLRFDGLILTRKFGVRPKMWLDTLGMANAEVKPFTGSASLAQCAKFFGLGSKGDAVKAAVGRRKSDFTAAGLKAYGEYAINDVDLTFEIFKKMRPRFSDPNELHLIDRLLRMYLEPSLELDTDLLAAHAQYLTKVKADALAAVLLDIKDARSNEKFAERLRAYGVEPPTKVSPVTGKTAYAFAKTDEAFTALLEDPDPMVSALVAARLQVKGSIEESYTMSMLDMGLKHRFALVALNANGAHTTRVSGGTGQRGSVNWQNLKRGSKLRQAIRAVRGRKIVAADASQIEARALATLAGQQNIVDAFARGEDVYALSATDIYGYPVSKDENPDERFVGKVSVLSCGYQSGGATYRSMARTLSNGKVVLSIEAATDIVQRWRRANPKIVAYWAAVEDVYRCVFTDRKPRRVPFGPFVIGKTFTPYEAGYVELPTGLRIWYPSPGYYVFERGGRASESFGYKRPMGAGGIKVSVSLYGGFCTENLVQGLCRVITLMQGVQIGKYAAAPWVMSVHDENVYHPLEKNAEVVAQACRVAMRTRPDFLPEIPLDCAVGIGDTYLDCK